MNTEPLAPGKRDPAGRRRAILRAATEIIVTLGPAALTHRAVAALAGVSLGSTTQYFSSIDELRETALHELAQEIDESLASVAPYLEHIQTHPEPAVTEFLRYIEDSRTVHADIALMWSATTDPRLRELALRWNDKLADMLTQHIGRERAEAVVVFLDGATIHAGLHEHPLSREAITNAILALAGPAPAPLTTTTPTAETAETHSE
ncbi:TetR/AcrR family transcriptional regulator [Leucobacter sp. BZR 635]